MRRKWISFAVIAAMALTVFAPMPALAKSKAKDPTLVKKVTYKWWDSEKKKWLTGSVTTYTYNKKGYPTKIAETDYTDGKKSGYRNVEKNKYKFKKDKPKSRVQTFTDYEPGEKPYTSKNTYKYNKKGFPSEQKYTSRDGDYKSVQKFKYKKGLMTQRTYWDYEKNKAGKWVLDSKAVTKYRVKQKKGLPKRIESIPAKGDGNYTAIEQYNKKGLLVKKGYRENGKSYTAWVYKYKMKKGRVVSVTRYDIEDGKKIADSKWTITYTKKKIAKDRYARMIDDILGSGLANVWY